MLTLLIFHSLCISVQTSKGLDFLLQHLSCCFVVWFARHLHISPHYLPRTTQVSIVIADFCINLWAFVWFPVGFLLEPLWSGLACQNVCSPLQRLFLFAIALSSRFHATGQEESLLTHSSELGGRIRAHASFSEPQRCSESREKLWSHCFQPLFKVKHRKDGKRPHSPA